MPGFSSVDRSLFQKIYDMHPLGGSLEKIKGAKFSQVPQSDFDSFVTHVATPFREFLNKAYNEGETAGKSAEQTSAGKKWPWVLGASVVTALLVALLMHVYDHSKERKHLQAALAAANSSNGNGGGSSQ